MFPMRCTWIDVTDWDEAWTSSDLDEHSILYPMPKPPSEQLMVVRDIELSAAIQDGVRALETAALNLIAVSAKAVQQQNIPAGSRLFARLSVQGIGWNISFVCSIYEVRG